MALEPATTYVLGIPTVLSSYVEDTLDAIVADLASEHGAEFDEDACRENMQPLVLRVEEMVRTMLGDSEVAFASGTFVGEDHDDGLDHAALEASGGTLS